MNKDRGISSLKIVFPVGSKDDPSGIEGLTHFLEHVLVKADINGRNLIQLCHQFDGEIHAATSKEKLVLSIMGDSRKFARLYEQFLKFILTFEGGVDLNQGYLEKEKNVIFNEMKYKASQFDHRQRETYFAEKWKHTSLAHPVLGYEASIERISAEDVIRQWRKVLQSYPQLQINHARLEDIEQLERLTAAFLDSKVMMTSDPYRAGLYTLVALMAQGEHMNAVEFNKYNLLCGLKLPVAARRKLLSMEREQLKNIMNASADNIQSDFMKTLVKGNPDFVLEEIVLLLKEVNINLHSSARGVSSSEQLTLRPFNAHRWCQVESGQQDQHFAAISIRPDHWIRQHIRAISDALLKYLHASCSAGLKVNCEMGIISIYIVGKVNQVMQAVKRLCQLNPMGAQLYYSSHLAPASEHHVSRICNYLLHHHSLTERAQPLTVTPLELFQRVVKQIQQGISIVTTLDLELVEGWTDNPLPVLLTPGDVNRLPSSAEPWQLPQLQHEYVEIWPGPNLFSEEKYLSHALWSMIEGLNGEMYRWFTLETSSLYSFTFFPRELFDFGYRIFYVHCPDPDRKSTLGASFREMLKSIYVNLDSGMLRNAKEKLRTRRERANTSLASTYIQLSAYLLHQTDCDAFFNYQAALDTVHLDSLKSYIAETIDSKTIIM